MEFEQLCERGLFYVKNMGFSPAYLRTLYYYDYQYCKSGHHTHMFVCTHMPACAPMHPPIHTNTHTHKHKHSVWLVVISCFKSCSSQILSLQTVCLYLQTDLQICKCALCSDKTAIAAAKIWGGLVVTKFSMQWQNCPFFLAVVNLQLQKQHVV